MAENLLINPSSGGGGGETWGSITGTLSNQTDLQTALDERALLDGTNQPFTGNLNLQKATPRFTITNTDSDDDPTAYLQKSTTDNLFELVSQNRPFVAGGAITTGSANNGAPFSNTFSDWSISFWIRNTDTNQNMFAGNTSNNTSLLVYWESNLFNLRVSGSTVSWSNTTVNDGNWHHVVFAIKKNASSQVYFDGVSLGNVTAPNADSVFTHILRGGTGSTSRGTFDEYIFFDSQIDSTKVAELYQSGVPYQFTNYTGVYAAWHLDTGSGAVYVDGSGNGRNITATTAPTWTTGVVAPSVQALQDTAVLSLQDGEVNNSLGILKLGKYSGTTSTTNIYEGLTHTFNILGTSKFAFDTTTATLGTSLTIGGAFNMPANSNFTMASGSGRIYIGSVGSAAAPAYSVSGDTNTGINMTGADQINFVTGGTVRVELSNSTTRFQSGSVSVPGVGFTGDTDAGLYNSAGLVGISSGNFAAATFTNATTTFNNTTSTLFNSSGTTKMTVTSTGVGIGTSPSNVFHVLGTNAATVASFVQPSSGTTITTPYPAFELVNTDATANNYVTFSFSDAVSGASYGLIGGKCTDHANNYGQIDFWTRGSSGGSTKMSIGENGGVVITMPTDINLSGMTAVVPTSATTIGGTYAGLSLVNTNTTNNNYARLDFLDAVNGTSSAVIVARFVNHTTKEGNLSLHVNNGSGRVERLDFYTSEAVFNESGGNIDLRVEGDTDANLLFADASTDRVGIGTATPAEKFDVNGTIRATAYNVGGTAGASGTFTTTDLKTVTVTNGIITSIV